MRDVRDWNKYVDLLGKAVGKRSEPPPHSQAAEQGLHRTAAAREASPEPAPNGGAPAADRPEPPRKGRGPRREETREELLARLLDPTLTLEETARMLEVCPTTVRRYTNRGILPHERSKGNQRRFKLSSVLAFLEAQRDSAEPSAAE